MQVGNDQEELKQLLKENIKVAQDNNTYLRRLYRFELIGFWVRVIWVVLIIGLPFALYFYVLEPYFQAFGGSYQQFIDGLNQLPGLKGIEQVLDQTFEK